MAWLVALTEFGDIAVLMPLATVMLVWLLLIRSPRDAAWWAIAVAFCAGSTAVLKVFYYGCPPTPALHSPSGHTSFSTLVYGSLTLVTATEGRRWRRMITIGGGVCFILAIAVSRLLLYIHTLPEVGLGLVIGAAALTIFGKAYPRCPATEVRLSPLLIAGVAVVLVLHGRELNAEQLLREIAGYIQSRCG
jgi:membrane-associated phospholipid phosphatase